jgi:hypothetical protein
VVEVKLEHGQKVGSAGVVRAFLYDGHLTSAPLCCWKGHAPVVQALRVEVPYEIKTWEK